MPNQLSCSLRTLLVAAIGALGLLAMLTPALADASRPADLRVVDPEGDILAQHTQYTGKVKVRTSPDADCFGDGTGGSGEKVTVPGATALGIVEDGGFWDGDIDPLGVTDAFDFGLGLCSIGAATAPSTGYWYLKVNHVGSLVGGDQARLKPGDEVLWYLIEDFNDPIPTELMLKAPNQVLRGEEFTVRVWEYADDGTRTPAEGATVEGASEPTDADGRTTIDDLQVLPDSEPVLVDLQAARAGSIHSQFEPVCIAQDLSNCQSVAPTEIRGSHRKDVIRGTRGADEIFAGRGRDIVRAGRGDDVIDVRGGGRDIVRCGAGEDVVRADKRDKLKGCA